MKAIGFRVIGHHPDQGLQWAPHGDFPKLGFLWVPMIRILVFWGLYWGLPMLETTIFCAFSRLLNIPP